jgi:hypothetical protein
MLYEVPCKCVFAPDEGAKPSAIIGEHFLRYVGALLSSGVKAHAFVQRR